MNKAFYPLIFGGDINVYSVARAFHEAYGIKSTCYGKYQSGPAAHSHIIDYHADPDIESAATFNRYVEEFAGAHKDGTVFVIGCGDNYVRLAAENRSSFADNVVVPYPQADQMKHFQKKEIFYQLCDQYGIDHPGTFIYKPEMGHDFTLPFKPPYVLKPSDSVTYWEHPFEGNDKVFFPKNREELLDILDRCYAAGYPDSMIIQEFVPGDDSNMRVLTNYSDHNGHVKLMCLGHVLLEEHSPHALGNHAVIITEYNEQLCLKIRDFLEEIHYTGFSNLDIKYDPRDGRYKAFDFNTRQGRSNYYVTGAGYNIAKYLVEDYVEGRDIPFEICQNESLWRVVPKQVEYDYISGSYHEQMQRLEKEGKATNSLEYSADNGLVRRIWLRHHMNDLAKRFEQYGTKKA